MLSDFSPAVLFVTPLLDGISWGIILILVSVGLTLIFGFLEVINFAHGAFYMLGGYVAFAVVGATGSFWLAILAAPVIIGILALIMELSLLRPFYDMDPLTQVIITLGAALVIEGAVVIIWGPRSKGIPIPDLFKESVSILGTTYPLYRLVLAIVGGLTIAAIWAVFRYSRIGLVIQASLSDKTMVRALGYDIPRIYTIVFVAGVALAGLTGALMVPLRSVGPGTANTVLLDIFIVVVVGGLGSFRGTIVAGLLIGMTDILVARYVSFRLSGITIFLILLVVLILRPYGLFGEKGFFE